jgi:hypothetical protein
MTIKEANLALANRYLKFIGFNRDQKMRNMCLTLIEHIDTWSVDKTSRWLGFIQYYIISQNLTTLEKEIKFSRPIFDSVDTILKECYGGFRSETNLDDSEEHF